MLVKDIMTNKVITITSDTYVLEAEKIMDLHKIGRLPIVDNEKLVGIVTKDDVLKASPSSTTSFNQRQLFYLVSKLTVKEIMKTKIITVTPETTVEKAVAVAQKNRVGSLPVVEGDRIVGILTTNDIFYKILNPLFGLGETGRRLIIYGAGEDDAFQNVMDVVRRAGFKIQTFWIPPGHGTKDLIIHLDKYDVFSLIESIEKIGFKVDIRDYEA